MVMAQVTRPANKVCTHTILPLNNDICRIKLDFTVSTFLEFVKSFQFKNLNLNFISDFQYSWASSWDNWGHYHYWWRHRILHQRYIQRNKPWKVCLTFNLWHQYRTTQYDSYPVERPETRWKPASNQPWWVARKKTKLAGYKVSLHTAWIWI